MILFYLVFFFSSRRRHTRWPRDWSSDVCSSDLGHDFVKKGRWTQGRAPLTRSLKNKTLGIVGLGRIGSAIAQRAEAFGMNILYHNRTRKADSPYRYVDNVRDLSAQSDALMLACPGGPATANLVDRAVLDALGPKGWVVNIARGSRS